MDVRVGDGIATIRQYLMAGLIDEMQLTISRVALRRGEHLLQGIELNALGYRITQHVATPNETHFVLRRSSGVKGPQLPPVWLRLSALCPRRPP
jgi:dihydrofolate reductase